jgi:hypothetical protein
MQILPGVVFIELGVRCSHLGYVYVIQCHVEDVNIARRYEAKHFDTENVLTTGTTYR